MLEGDTSDVAELEEQLRCAVEAEDYAAPCLFHGFLGEL